MSWHFKDYRYVKASLNTRKFEEDFDPDDEAISRIAFDELAVKNYGYQTILRTLRYQTLPATWVYYVNFFSYIRKNIFVEKYKETMVGKKRKREYYLSSFPRSLKNTIR